MWMASYDAENTIVQAMLNSLYEDGYTFPERKLIYQLISISSKITATETGYDITIQNNAANKETNPALKNAESFMTSILNMKVYITSKSGAEFSPGKNSGTVINEGGQAIIDLFLNKNSRNLNPNSRHYIFSVGVSGILMFKIIK